MPFTDSAIVCTNRHDICWVTQNGLNATHFNGHNQNSLDKRYCNTFPPKNKTWGIATLYHLIVTFRYAWHACIKDVTK